MAIHRSRASSSGISNAAAMNWSPATSSSLVPPEEIAMAAAKSNASRR
jgi:hypothetical protein